MAAKRDFYEVLGIDKNADEATIKKAYRKLAKKYHPDMNKGNPNAEKIFQEVTEAYEVLGDPKKRKLYDEYGPISLEAGFDPEKMKQAQYGNPFGNGGFYQSYSSGEPGSGYQEFHFDGSSDMDDILDKLFGKKGAAEMTKAIRENRIDLTSLSSSMEEYGSTVEDTYNGTLDPIDNAKVAMNNAKLALSTLASTAQTSAAPMIEKLTGKIQELTQWFTSLSPAQQETVLKVGLVVAAIGPLSIGFGKVAKGISDTVTTGQKFVSGAAKIIAKITAKTAATAAPTSNARINLGTDGSTSLVTWENRALE